MTESIIFSTYPLSADYERAVRQSTDSLRASTLSIAQLRAEGTLEFVKKIFRIRAERIVIPFEDQHSAALSPILMLLAAFTRCPVILVVHPDGRVELVRRTQLLGEFPRLALASIHGIISATKSAAQLCWLSSQSRIDVDTRVSTDTNMVYLKTNLWFGVKAGGSIGHIAGVVNALRRRGHRVTFAACEPPVMLDTGVEFLNVAPPKSFGLPYELNNYRLQSSFYKTLKKSGVITDQSAIYQRQSIANFLGVLLSRRYRRPLIVEYNGSEVWVAKNWGRPLRFHRLAQMAETVMLQHAHLVVTVSEALRDELIDRGIEPRRIVTYPNCIDPGVFNPGRFSQSDVRDLRSRYRIDGAATVVTFVGTFGQWHGVEVLAKAIVSLRDEHPKWLEDRNLHFMLVGDGAQMQEVRSILDSCIKDGLVTLTGLVPQSQAPLHLAASDILSSPHVPNADGSRFFGSPTKLFEYMAMGKAIVASELAQIGDVLRGGIHVKELPSGSPLEGETAAAVLCRPGSAKEHADAIKFLVDREDWRQCLGSNARSRALEKYTWGVHVDAIVGGLSSL
jgi:glycosyltransferase involved in cell wall biosynthesis